MPGLTPLERETLAHFAVRLRQFFGSRVRNVQLFGSKARGTATPDSDVDVLVIMDQLTWSDEKAIHALAAHLLLETGVDISAKVYSPLQIADMQLQRNVFWQSLEHDALPL